MKKVKITADAVLAIIQGIFNDDEINVAVDDPSAPPEWIGKAVKDVLNVEYYTFKHRPQSTQSVINKLFEETGQANQLAAVNRAFCLCSLGDIERLFSKDVDMVVVPATLEYGIQSRKIKLLESLIEDCNIALSGIRIPVQFGTETRKAVVVFSRVSVGEIQTSATYGEWALAEVEASILLYPDVVSYSDYTVDFSFTGASGQTIDTEALGQPIPLASLSFVNTMTQKAVPRQREVGNINLSNAKSFVLVFDGYNHPFINYLTDKTLGQSADNNQVLILKITRAGAKYTHDVVIKDHQVIINADTSNETHTLALVKKGANNGAT